MRLPHESFSSFPGDCWCFFLSRVPPTFPRTAVFYLLTRSWGSGGGEVAVCKAPDLSVRARSPACLSPLEGRRMVCPFSRTQLWDLALLQTCWRSLSSKALLLTNASDPTPWILELLENLEIKFNSPILGEQKLSPKRKTDLAKITQLASQRQGKLSHLSHSCPCSARNVCESHFLPKSEPQQYCQSSSKRMHTFVGMNQIFVIFEMPISK